MAKIRLENFRGPTISATVLSAALVLAGCGEAEDSADTSGPDEQQTTTMGVRLSAPGLVSGVDPAHVSGVEVDLAAALGQRLGVADSAEDITWVPADTASAAEDLATGDMDLVIGQFTRSQLSEDIAWVGPYATVEPGLLVRDPSAAAPDETEQFIATEAVTSGADLETSSICVVAGSLADGAELPAAEVTPQQTVTECESGMRSGRYDAVAADDLQLAGLLTDASLPATYDLLLWSDLDDTDDALDEQLMESSNYWIGVSPDQCDSAAAALSELIADGAVEEFFGQWDTARAYQPQLVEAEDVTTKHCD